MLSKREKEVLRLIAAGATDAEAAGRLGVSKSTVQTHIYNMLQRPVPGVAATSLAWRSANAGLRTRTLQSNTQARIWLVSYV